MLKFGREREGVDLSEVVLTHHNLRNRGKQSMKLKDDQYPELQPLDEAGSGEVREAKKAFLNEITEKVNDLFSGDLTDSDKLVYVKDVILGKLLESEVLVQQAKNNSKERFSESPDFDQAQIDAIIESEEAHVLMAAQALASTETRKAMKEVLLKLKLYELLRGETEDTA